MRIRYTTKTGRKTFAVIQSRNIEINTKTTFVATYKGYEINITTEHGHGKPDDKDLKRYDIDVIHLESGMYDVQTWEDLLNVRQAILYALEGAMLIDKQKTE